MTSSAPPDPFVVDLNHSRTALQVSEEAQVLYTHISVRPPQRDDVPPAPPLNMCLVLDRSTSMTGERLDTARSSAVEIMRLLRPQDHFGLVTFSDKAEVLIPSDAHLTPTAANSRLIEIQTSGATEILKGLSAGLAEVRRASDSGTLDHLILITDGRTYGDEKACLELADQAAHEGIEITAIGVGEAWNDIFLDAVASKTGGQAVYIENVSTLSRLLKQKFRELGLVYADQINLMIDTAPGVMMQSAFRISPAPIPLPGGTTLRLGSLFSGTSLSLLLQFVVSTIPEPLASFEICTLHFGAHLAQSNLRLKSSMALSFPVLKEAAPVPISGQLLTAARSVNLYHLQEKALSDARSGDTELGTRRLNRLATQLLEIGHGELARAVIAEAEALAQDHKLSERGQKRVKYGTRALLEAHAEGPR
jgi:Ca-activated chloride channel family protein